MTFGPEAHSERNGTVPEASSFCEIPRVKTFDCIEPNSECRSMERTGSGQTLGRFLLEKSMLSGYKARRSVGSPAKPSLGCHFNEMLFQGGVGLWWGRENRERLLSDPTESGLDHEIQVRVEVGAGRTMSERFTYGFSSPSLRALIVRDNVECFLKS